VEEGGGLASNGDLGKPPTTDGLEAGLATCVRAKHINWRKAAMMSSASSPIPINVHLTIRYNYIMHVVKH